MAKTIWRVLGIGLGAGLLGCGAAAEGDAQDEFVWDETNAAISEAEVAPGSHAEPVEFGTARSALLRQNASGPDGGACTVTGGVNKGKRGKFEDGWCCGPTFCTECINQDGTDNGKCSAGKVAATLDVTLVSGGLDGFAIAR